jgi:hypothetical protein
MSLGRDFFNQVAQCESGHDLEALLRSSTEPKSAARRIEAANLIGKIVGARFDPYPVLDHYWFGSSLFVGGDPSYLDLTVDEFLAGEATDEA